MFIILQASVGGARTTCETKMATPVQTVTRQVKPLLSLSQGEARRRVFSLYKAWIRQIPFICKYQIFE